MGYGIRDGDIIATDNQKFGALTMSQPLHAYPEGEFSPEAMWRDQPNVRTVVDFMTRAISLVPYDVYQRQDSGGRLRVRDHRVQSALKSPQPRQGMKRLVQRLMLDMVLFGRWAVGMYPDGGELELLRVDPRRMSLVADPLGRFNAVRIYPDAGQPRDYDIADFLFDVAPDDGGPQHRRGLSPVTVLENLAREAGVMNSYRRDLVSHAAQIPAVIERPQGVKWSPEARQRFREDFSTYRAGGGNAGGIPILEDGMAMRPVQTYNPKDLEYPEVRRLSLIEAAQVLQIPPELVGAKDGTHSNIQALREQLYVDVLGADIGYMEDALNTGLAQYLSPDMYVEANLEVRLRATFVDRVKAYQSAVGGPFMTREEVRNRENLEFLEGTNELIVPLNVVEGGLASPNDTGQTNEAGRDPLKGVVRPKAGEPSIPVSARTSTQLARKRLEAEVLTTGGRLREEWLERIGAREDSGSKGMKVSYGESVARAIGGSLGLPTIDPDQVVSDVAEMVKVTYPRMLDVMSTASKDNLRELGIEGWERWSAATQSQWCYTTSQEWAKSLIHSQFSDVVSEAVAADPAGWRDAVLEKLGSESALTRSAQTLGTELESVGRNDAAKSAGAVSKTWVVTSRNPRPSHRAMDGETVPLNDIFSNGMRWPGDHSGKGPETANCRCVLRYSRG